MRVAPAIIVLIGIKMERFFIIYLYCRSGRDRRRCRSGGEYLIAVIQCLATAKYPSLAL